MPVIGDTEKVQSSTSKAAAGAPTESESAAKAAFQHAMETFGPAMDAQDNHQPVDFPALRKAMEKYWAEFPDVHRSVTLLTYYMDMFAKAHPERVLAEWGLFTECRSPLAAELARAKVRFADLSREPFDLKFVALDGRSVDVGKLRGKVILIDFWATWCGPCIQQLPALKHLYSEYHEKGFEIIGVSLDRAEDKRKLVDFLSREGIAWPQHFDGRVWQNEIAARYAINSAPTTFLLDKDGRLAGISPEEPKLEDELKRLLGLDQQLDQKARVEPDGPANGSQPIRSETNRTSSAAGSRR
jgi:thiol-disulfide isomerase/thioredoxin